MLKLMLDSSKIVKNFGQTCRFPETKTDDLGSIDTAKHQI